MSTETLDRAGESDAPFATAVHQRDIGKEIAEQHDWHSAALVGRTVTVGRPRAELFAFWRDFRNLARFMENIDAVDVLGDRRSRWTIRAPAGRTVEFETEITEEVPDQLIAWESVPGSGLRNSGQIEFFDAPAGRGTYVRATMAYEPPAGEIGKAIAKLFQKEPKIQARRDMRRFKQLMETGEVTTSKAPDAAPRGGLTTSDKK